MNSLRIQLLIWIAMPAAIVLLVVSFVEIRGHERAMQRLVQERADSLSEAVATLVSTQIDRGQDALLQIAGDPAIRADWDALDSATDSGYLPEVALFSAGFALLEPDGAPILANGDQSWLDWPEVAKLRDTILRSQAAATSAVQREAEGWLLLQATPVYAQDGTVDMMLVGAMPLQALELASLIGRLTLNTNADLYIKSAEGDQLFKFTPNDPNAEPGRADRTVTAQAIIEPLGWQVVLNESWADLVPPMLRFENIILLVVMMAVLVSILTIYFGLRNIIQPLRRLDAAAGQVAWGNYEQIEASVGGVQEIEDLRMALARMTSQIQQYQQELQSYIGAMTLGQEEERKRLARELHDETIQGLIALSQQIEVAERRLEKDPQDAAQRLRDLRPLLNDTITGLRRQIHDLRPPYLEDLGFVTALEMLVKQIAQRHNLINDFDVIGPSYRRLPAAIEISAYRIVQEALQNVANHAQASWVHVELTFDDTGVVLRVEDDGCGFTVPAHLYQQAQTGHFGLLGIQERAQMNGGHLRIESEVGKGTTVITWLPAPADEKRIADME